MCQFSLRAWSIPIVYFEICFSHVSLATLVFITELKYMYIYFVFIFNLIVHLTTDDFLDYSIFIPSFFLLCTLLRQNLTYPLAKNLYKSYWINLLLLSKF